MPAILRSSKSKVYPEEKDKEKDKTEQNNNPSSSSSPPTPCTSVDLKKQGNVEEKESIIVPGTSSSVQRVPASKRLEWDEIIEDLDLAIENTRTKSELYRLNGEPLKRTLASNKEIGLHLITEQIMDSYGIEFLSIVSEILVASEGLGYDN